MVAAKIGVLFLIAVAAGVALLGMRRWSTGSRGRGSFHRHWITRLVCGLVGGGLLVALMAVTLADARFTGAAIPPVA